MQWIIHYDIVAFAIISAILIVFSIFNNLKTFTNRVYKRLLIVSLLSVVTDIASSVTGSYFSTDYPTLNYIMNMLHYITQNYVPCLYSLFAYSMVYETGKMSKKWFSLIYVPYIINFILIIINPFTNIYFYFDDLGNYVRGIGIFIPYGIAIYYIILSCIIVIFNMKVLGLAQRCCVFLYSAECIILNVLQVMFPKYLLSEIGIAFSMFFIYLTMQNPFEFMDVQTGVYNRNLFKKTITGKIFKKEEFSILCVQIEGLKYINEKFGESNGNILIKQITSYLLSFEKNCSVYRISNRLFALVFQNHPDLDVFCKRIASRFESSFHISSINVSANMWAHITCLKSSDDIQYVEDVFDIIEYSLKEFAHDKKTTVSFVSTDVLEELRRDLAINEAISNAIKNDSFQVFYQPIYSLEEKRFVKMEALVRLFDEKIGFVPPDQFISIAEKNGDILVIGEIVLKKVCQFITENHPERFGIKRISVNLSVVQCMQENINVRLMDIIDKYEIPHDFIDFEITETTAINTSETLKKIMKNFNQQGIYFSLDDFGTGYSNQSNIMQYPYSIVKIDKSLVWACDSNPKAFISLKHTVAMIKDLEMSVLAEGVETDKHKNLLEEIGVEYLQGFYFSKPLSPLDTISFLEKNN